MEKITASKMNVFYTAEVCSERRKAIQELCVKGIFLTIYLLANHRSFLSCHQFNIDYPAGID